MCTCIHVHMCACIHARVHMHACACVRTYKRAYMHAYICTYCCKSKHMSSLVSVTHLLHQLNHTQYKVKVICLNPKKGSMVYCSTATNCISKPLWLPCD